MAHLGALARATRRGVLAGVLAGLAAVAGAAEQGTEAARIVEALRLGTGMVAADVGAGEGRFTAVLARGVGPSGRVFATEVEPDKLDEVKARMAGDGIDNVSTVLGDQLQTGLPAGCCDRILLRLVYHHFADPKAMQRSLWAALRPGGQIAVIDVPPKKSWPRVTGAPDRGGHGIEASELVAEMRGAGFELVAHHEQWPAEPDSYCVVFRRPALVRAEAARFRVPADPPVSHYSIDARVDPEKGVVEGRETVTFDNRSTLALGVLALDWTETRGGVLDVSVGGRALPLHAERRPGPAAASTVWLALPDAIPPGGRLAVDVRFRRTWDVSGQEASFSATDWYPRFWWDGLPHHDSYSVELGVPAAYALAASGRLDPRTDRFESEGVRAFGVYLGRGMKAESRDADGVLVTALFTEKDARGAAVCLDTAVDAVRFYRDWLGFYPHPFLTVVPGGSGGRWGGYPVATGIVAIHGLETYAEGESPQHWQHITSHEIGHQYWGEWVLDGDRPEWLWIGMGIYADTEYMTARKLDPDRGVKWRGNYLQGIERYYETPLEVTEADEARIHYDRNNVVVHSKGPALLGALEVVLGRPVFQRIYRQVAREWGGKRLGWRDLQRACEQETGESLAWFFEPWVRSSAYLSYAIDAKESRPEGQGFRTEMRVRRVGTMAMPVPVKVVFEDGEEQTARVDRTREVDVLVFRSRTRLREAVLDPERKLAMLEKPLPDIAPEAAAALAWGWRRADSLKVYELIRSEAVDSAEVWLRLGTQLYDADRYGEALDCFGKVAALEAPTDTRFAARAWMGILEDVRGNRDAALGHYREALRLDPGRSLRLGLMAVEVDGNWVRQRLAEPFRRETRLVIPSRPTAEDLVRLVEQLQWKHEGRNPLSIFEKTRGLAIPQAPFWMKLALLLFDGGDYAESMTAFENVVGAPDVSPIRLFAAWTWKGHLNDLQGRREEAIACYRKALEVDPGTPMQHSQYAMTIDRRWLARRLRTPFTWGVTDAS